MGRNQNANLAAVEVYVKLTDIILVVCMTHIVCALDNREGCAYDYRVSRAGLYGCLGAAIRERRRELGLTQADLARRVGISRASLASVETGRQGVLVHRLYVFADKLGVEVESLLPRREEAADLRRLDKLRFSEDVSLATRQEFARLLRHGRGSRSAF